MWMRWKWIIHRPATWHRRVFPGTASLWHFSAKSIADGNVKWFECEQLLSINLWDEMTEMRERDIWTRFGIRLPSPWIMKHDWFCTFKSISLRAQFAQFFCPWIFQQPLSILLENGNGKRSKFYLFKLFALIDSEWPLIGPNYSITLLTMRFFVQTRSTNAFFLNIRAMKHGQRPLSNSKPKRNCARVVCPVRSALNLRQFAIFPLFAHEIKNQSENINDKMKNELVSGC